MIPEVSARYVMFKVFNPNDWKLMHMYEARLYDKVCEREGGGEKGREDGREEGEGGEGGRGEEGEGRQEKRWMEGGGAESHLLFLVSCFLFLVFCFLFFVFCFLFFVC